MGSVATRLLRYPRAHRLVVFDGVYWQWLSVGLDDHACIGYNIATVQSVLTVLIAHMGMCSVEL